MNKSDNSNNNNNINNNNNNNNNNSPEIRYTMMKKGVGNY